MVKLSPRKGHHVTVKLHKTFDLTASKRPGYLGDKLYQDIIGNRLGDLIDTMTTHFPNPKTVTLIWNHYDFEGRPEIDVKQERRNMKIAKKIADHFGLTIGAVEHPTVKGFPNTGLKQVILK